MKDDQDLFTVRSHVRSGGLFANSNQGGAGGQGGGAGGGGEDGGGGGGGGGGEEKFGKDEAQRMINGALKSWETRFQKTIEGMFTPERLAPVLEQFTKTKEPDSGGSGGKGGGGEIPEEIKNRMAAMERQSKELQQQLEAERKARQEEREKALRHEERSTLMKALQEAGVDPKMIDFAVATLYTERGLVKRTEDGQIVWKAQRDGYVDDLPVTKGVAEWLKTDEGKRFLPASGAGGSGATGGGTGGERPPQFKNEREKRKWEAQQVLNNAFRR
jgi:hypothetical protein